MPRSLVPLPRLGAPVSRGAAQVALSTDNGATWKDLYTVDGEVSADWEEVEVDLTKYLGSVGLVGESLTQTLLREQPNATP